MAEDASKQLKELFDAVEQNDLKLVKSLVANSLPAKSANPKGETAAHIAAKLGKIAILEYLLATDESLLKARDKSGQNVLHVATVNGRTETVQYLLENCHVDFLHKDNIHENNTVVHLAAREGHMDLMRYFMERHHVDPNVLNEKGQSPAFLAAGNKQLPIIVYLHEKHGASLELYDYENRNILYPAAMLSGDVTIPQYVLDGRKIKMFISWRDKGKRTVLHWSALNNFEKITKYFVEVKRVELDSPDLMKFTALHLAAEAGHIRIVQYLYEQGADPQMVDMYGKTPKDLAKDKKIISFFEEYPEKRKRFLRSVPRTSLLDTRLPASNSYLTYNEPLPYNRVGAISADPVWLSGRLGNSGPSQLQHMAASPGLDGFLAWANVLVMGGKRRSMNRNQSLQTPSHVDLLVAGVIGVTLDDTLRD